MGFVTGFPFFISAAWAQNATKDQLLSLVPDENDLQGFVRIRPADEIPPGATLRYPAALLEDWIGNTDLRERWRIAGTASYITRRLYSTDTVFRVDIRINVCDSPDTAGELLKQTNIGSSLAWTPGTFSGAARIGDESRTHPSAGGHTLMFRYGRVFVIIDGALSNVALRSGVQSEFPSEAVESIAYMVLLRLARQAKLTDVPAQEVALTVNGKPLLGAPLGVGRQVYVPVAELAKAAGWQCRWDAKTGDLKLSRAAGPPITLAAGSTAAKTAAEQAVSLHTPVLKEAGQPVMELEDLLRLMKGRIVKRDGNKLTLAL